MTRHPEVPVLIAGAGPTGLTLAAELLRHGVPCRLIDRAAGPSTISKAIAIQPRTLELLEPLGVSARLVAHGVQARQAFAFAEGALLARFDFDGLDSAYPYMLMVPQPDTERILLEVLAAWGVQPERGVELVAMTQDAEGVSATLQDHDGTTRELRAAWLVGCDGAHSAVRRALGLPFGGRTIAQRFLLADVRLDWSRPRDAVHVATVGGALLGIFPLPDDRARIVATEPAPTTPGEPPAPSLAEVQAIVTARAPFPARLSDARWTARFGVNSRIATRFHDGRVILAGDAAHIHSPAGGQGMNTGMHDAVNLAWKLALAVRGEAAPAIVESYQAERHPVDRAVIRSTDLLLDTMAARGGARAFLRDHVGRYVAGSRGVQRRLRRVLAQLTVQYRGSSIVEEHPLDGGPHAGDRAPDAWATTVEGALARVATLGDTVRHTLLVLHAPCTPTAESAIALQHAHAMWLRAVSLADPPPGAVPRGWPRPLGDVYGRTRPCVYLLRPDGYVGMRAPLARAEEALVAYRDRLGLRVGG